MSFFMYVGFMKGVKLPPPLFLSLYNALLKPSEDLWFVHWSKRALGWKMLCKKNDAFIKIPAEIENKMTYIESTLKFVQIWTIFLSATFSSDIFSI